MEYSVWYLEIKINTWPMPRYQAYQASPYYPSGKGRVPGQYASNCGDGHVLNFSLHVYAQVYVFVDVSDIIYEAEGACERRYGFTRGPIWVRMSGLLCVWNHEQYQPG